MPLLEHLKANTSVNRLFVNRKSHSNEFDYVINARSFAGLREGLQILFALKDGVLVKEKDKKSSPAIVCPIEHKAAIAEEMSRLTPTLDCPGFDWDVDHEWVTESTLLLRAHPLQLPVVMLILEGLISSFT